MPGRTTLDVFVVGVSLAVPTIYDGKAQQLRSMKNSDGLTKADLLIPDGIREEGFAHFSLWIRRRSGNIWPRGLAPNCLSRSCGYDNKIIRCPLSITEQVARERQRESVSAACPTDVRESSLYYAPSLSVLTDLNRSTSNPPPALHTLRRPHFGFGVPPYPCACGDGGCGEETGIPPPWVMHHRDTKPLPR